SLADRGRVVRRRRLGDAALRAGPARRGRAARRSRRLRAPGEPGAHGPAMSRRGRRGPRVPPRANAVSDERGVRYLHFGSVWVQGAMRLRRPWDIELDYLRHMMAWQLFVEPRGEILQIGLGAASLAKYAWKRLPQARVVVVEIDPAVVAVARQ